MDDAFRIMETSLQSTRSQRDQLAVEVVRLRDAMKLLQVGVPLISTYVVLHKPYLFANSLYMHCANELM